MSLMAGFAALSGVLFGAGGVSWLMLDRLYLEPQRTNKIKEMDKVRNFQQFLCADHIPNADAYYAIERKEKEELMKGDIIKSALIPQVVNIVAPKELGKSYLLKKVAKQIDVPYKVFYLNASETLRVYLRDEYQWDFSSEIDVISELFYAVKKYRKSNPKEKIIVILDSPGGIKEDPESGKITEYTLDFLIKSMKTSVADSVATFYCISSIPNNIFTEERVQVFGKGRFKQIRGDQWIDLSMSIEEMVALIDKYEQEANVKINDETRLELMSYNIPEIGVFVQRMTEFTFF